MKIPYRISTMTQLSHLSSQVILDKLFTHLQVNDTLKYIQHGENIKTNEVSDTKITFTTDNECYTKTKIGNIGIIISFSLPAPYPIRHPVIEKALETPLTINVLSYRSGATFKIL